LICDFVHAPASVATFDDLEYPSRDIFRLIAKRSC
jgi:hypothetical protein